MAESIVYRVRIAEDKCGKTRYIPLNAGRRLPGLLGMPGFAATHKESRVDRHLKQAAERGVYGVGVTYRQVNFENGEIKADFSLLQYVTEMKDALETLASTDRVDKDRIGIFASSVSGTIVSYLMAKAYPDVNPKFPIRAIALVSPMTSWAKLYNPQMRTSIVKQVRALTERGMEFFPLAGGDSPEERLRLVKNSSIDEIMALDSLGILEEGIVNCTEFKPKILTLGGREDTVVDPESIEQLHKLLGGHQDDIRIYEKTGHVVPWAAYESRLINFFIKTLLEK